MASMKCGCGQLNWVDSGASGSCLKCGSPIGASQKGPTTAVLEVVPPVAIEPPKKKGTLIEDTLQAFAWGLKGVGPLLKVTIVTGAYLVTMLVMNMIAGASLGPSAYLLGNLVIFTWYYGYQTSLSFQIVQGGALRTDEFPSLPPMFAIDTTFIPFFQGLGWTLFALLPSAVCVALGIWFHSIPLLIAAIPAFVLCAPIYFLGFLGLSLHDSLWALSPTGMVKSLLRRPESIGFSIFMLVLTMGASLFAATAVDLCSSLLPNFWLRIGLRIAGLLLSLYFTAVFGRMLGLLHYHRSGDLQLMKGE